MDKTNATQFIKKKKKSYFLKITLIGKKQIIQCSFWSTFQKL